MTLINVKNLSLSLALSVLSACSNAENEETPPLLSHKSGEVSHDIPKPAILLESNTQNTQIIQQAMSAALNGKKVTLNRNAFTKRPHHILQKRSFKQTNLQHADGLILGVPEVDRFSLFTFRNTCYLTYNNGVKKIPLADVECTPFS